MKREELEAAGVDVEDGLGRVLGNEQLYERLLGIFAQDTSYDELARAMERGGKIVSAICAAPMVLAKAGLLEGKQFTMYPGLDEYLPAGYRYESAMAVRDGRIVTGKGPGAVFAFAKELAGALGAETSALYEAMFVNA